MRVISEARERYPEINEMIALAAQSSSVQGVVIGVNPTLITIWRLRNVYGDKWLRRTMGDFYYFPRPWVSTFEFFVDLLKDQYLTNDYWFPDKPIGLYDLDDAIDFISKNIEHPSFNKNTIRITVCTYPGMIYEPPGFIQESEAVRLFVEARPISRLWSNTKKEYRPVIGGISIGADLNTYGTLGGVVSCKSNGKKYGITCAHVVGNGTDVFQPAKADSGEKVIGKVISSSPLIELPAEDHYNKNLSSANSMDVAVIELTEDSTSSVLDLGNVSGIFPQWECTPHQSTCFTGRSSGYRYFLENDGDIPFYDLFIDDKKYRYTDLMQIRFKSRYDMLTSEPSKEGDSGAWVCMPKGDKMLWAGMIVGGYFQTAYAISSEKIVSWIKDEAGLELTC